MDRRSFLRGLPLVGRLVERFAPEPFRPEWEDWLHAGTYKLTHITRADERTLIQSLGTIAVNEGDTISMSFIRTGR